jgi:hypothetical protein
MAASSYHSSGLGGLFLGRAISHFNDIQYGPMPYSRSTNWYFHPGTYKPKQFFAEIAILPESVITQLGADNPGETDTRAILMDGLRSSLSHEGREATLLLADWNSENSSEATKHILKIGKALYDYASESNHVVPGDPNLTVYSPCEGHKWVPPAGRLLRSHRSSPILMMLYNEWLHQITCLRDGLIPFENFEDVALNLRDVSAKGARPLEEIRKAFASEISRGRLSHESIIEIAKVFTAPNLPAGGYGFQYDKGIVLPAVLFSGGESQFLRYIPTSLVESSQQPVIFDFELEDSPSEDKVEISSISPASSAPPRLLEAKIIPEPPHKNHSAQSQLLKLMGTYEDNSTFSVDVGRIVRGLRAAHYVSREEHEKLKANSRNTYEASEILSCKGVVINSSHKPVVVRATSPVDRLALLAKLEQVGVYLHTEESLGVGCVLNEYRTEVPHRFLIVGGQPATE